MKSFYQVPEIVKEDINRYQEQVELLKAGKIHPVQFKGFRVPCGVYEQRTPNTYMMRIRIPGGGVTPHQIQALALLAKEYGNGLLHVTTRQDLQLHNLKLEDPPEIMEKLFALGLTSKGGGGNTVRNITGCYDSGVCSREIFDVTPYVIAVTEFMLPDPRSYLLPRKFKIAFSGCPKDCSFATVNDLGFIAKEKKINGQMQKGFSVYVGGGMGAHSRVAIQLAEFIPVEELVYYAQAAKNLFDKYGNRKNKHKARLRFFLDKVGEKEFLRIFSEELSLLKEKGELKLKVRDLKESMLVRDERTKGRREKNTDLLFDKWQKTAVTPQRQENYFFVKIRLPLGDIISEQLLQLAEISRKFGEGSIRTTHDQNFILRWIHQDELFALYQELKLLGLPMSGANSVKDIICCTGAATCKLGLCLSRNLTAEISKKLEEEPKFEEINDLKIRISGCPNSCGQHPIGQIGIAGAARREKQRMAPFYRILLGGKVEEGKTALAKEAGVVPAKNVSLLIKEFLLAYGEGKADLEKKGMELMQTLVEKYEHIPAYEEDSSYYRDLGVDQEFSLAGFGPGECGAGIFDMIEVDLKEAEENLILAKEKLGQKKEEEAAKLFYQSAIHAMRSLLVVRGAEAKTEADIFSLFEKEFVRSNLVENKFQKLAWVLDGFGQGNVTIKAVLENVVLIEELAGVMKNLYNSLDDSMQFKKEEPKEIIAQEKIAVMKTLDLKGVACPFNYVKAKLVMEDMEVNETIELFLDEGEPIRNVPVSLKNDGQIIELMEKTPTGHYRLIVKKKV